LRRVLSVLLLRSRRRSRSRLLLRSRCRSLSGLLLCSRTLARLLIMQALLRGECYKIGLVLG
jgi:hypothetical protein